MQRKLSHILTIFFLSSVAAFAASEEKLSRQLDAKPGGKLIVDVDFGTINVSPGTDDKVVIEAYRKIDFGDEAKEKEYLSTVPITIGAESDSVIVRARAPKNTPHHSWHHVTMDGHYTVQVPKNFTAELKSGGGSISARELAGELRAESGGGKLQFVHLSGARVANTGGGSIQVDNCDGASDVKTGGGDIVSTDGRGTLRARTGGGSIEVRNFSGDTDVESGGGELNLEKIAGRISGETSGGSITASVSENAEINLESSGGSIELSLPATAAVDIDAATSSGRIKSNLPIETTRLDEDHLRGKLNGGGKRVLLRTAAGSITIKSIGETAAR